MLEVMVGLAVALVAAGAVLYRVAARRRSDFGLGDWAAERSLMEEQRRASDGREIRVVERRSPDGGAPGEGSRGDAK